MKYLGRSRYWFWVRRQARQFTEYESAHDGRCVMFDADELDAYIAARPAARPRVKLAPADTPAPEPARGP